MKQKFFLPVLATMLLFIASCKKNDPAPTEYGTFKVQIDNVVNDIPLVLDTAGYQQYRYTLSNGQKFNFSYLAYYISEIKLTGPNGEVFTDKLSVTAAESKGYYFLNQATPSSRIINLSDVPAGTYNKITFTVGVNEAGVQSGAAGGVLDPATGGLFWSWNAGYIGFGMEGTADNSPMPFTDYGSGMVAYEKTYQLHVGGWKTLAADSSGVQNFVNNVRTVSFDFSENVTVSKTDEPEAHLHCDPTAVLNAANQDFSQRFQAHTPGKGAPFADHLPKAFSIDHIHQ